MCNKTGELKYVGAKYGAHWWECVDCSWQFPNGSAHEEAKLLEILEIHVPHCNGKPISHCRFCKPESYMDDKEAEKIADTLPRLEAGAVIEDYRAMVRRYVDEDTPTVHVDGIAKAAMRHDMAYWERVTARAKS